MSKENSDMIVMMSVVIIFFITILFIWFYIGVIDKIEKLEFRTVTHLKDQQTRILELETFIDSVFLEKVEN